MNRQSPAIRTQLIDLLSQLTIDFTAHPKHQNYRVPARPTPLDPLCEFVGADPGLDLHEISRTLFTLQWNSGLGFTAIWQLCSVRLPSGDRAYWIDDGDGRRVIAVGPGGVGADAAFSRALFKSNGKKFGTAILDSLPSSVFTHLRGEGLIDLFRSAIRTSDNDAWTERWGLPNRHGVRKWLKEVLTQEGKELRLPLSREQRLIEFFKRVLGVISDFTPHPLDDSIHIAPQPVQTSPIAKSVGVSRRTLPALLSRGLVRFVWWGVPGSTTTWAINAFDLPGGRSVYWVETDFGMEEEDDKRLIIATGNSDEQLIDLLFAPNGKDFGIEGPGGSPPLELHSRLSPECLVRAFTALFTASKCWEQLDVETPEDFDSSNPEHQREVVVRWLDEVCPWFRQERV